MVCLELSSQPKSPAITKLKFFEKICSNGLPVKSLVVAHDIDERDIRNIKKEAIIQTIVYFRVFSVLNYHYLKFAG